MFRTITPIFSIILAIAIYFLFTSEIFVGIKATQVEAEGLEVAVLEVKKFNDELERLLAIKRSMSSERDRIEAFVSTETDEVRMLVDLEAMAKRHNMLLGNISVTKATAETAAPTDVTAMSSGIGLSDFMSTDISFGLIGTYEDFRAILAELERSLVLMEIIDISHTANEGDLQQFDLTVRAYALKSVAQ